MGNNDRRPKIRFKGFNDDWEQHEFGEIFKLSQGLQIPISKRYLEKATNRYFYITNEFLKDSCEKVYYIESPAENVICTKDDILMTRTGNTGIVITDVEGCFHNNFFKIQYNKDLFSKNYICYLLKSEKMKKKILNSAGSSTIPDLSHKSFYKIDAKFPILKEQYKIGEFFKQLDSLIVLHQRKLEKLGNIKKSMLEKMFPKDENKVPEIRFKGFNDDWEQHKLEEYIYELKSGLSRMLSSDDIGLPVVRANNIENNKLDMENDVKYWYKNDPQGADTSNYLIKKYDILVNFINSESKMGTATIVEDEPIRDTIYTTNILRMRTNEKCDNYFFLAQTNNKKYKDYIKGISKIAVNQASFTTGDFKNFDISTPKIEEQNKIGLLFKRLDSLIALHQRKLEKLKNIKKACLEKMFV